MNGEERRAILRMLAEGKISVEEAEMLLDALGDTGERRESAGDQQASRGKRRGAFFSDSDFGNTFGDFADCFDIFGKFDDFTGVFNNFGDMFAGGFKEKDR